MSKMIEKLKLPLNYWMINFEHTKESNKKQFTEKKEPKTILFSTQ